MKHIVAASLCLVSLVALTGCQSSSGAASSALSVQIEGQGQFPLAIAGRWKADRDGWEFEFAPDGRILSAVLSLGRVKIEPGKAVTVPTKGGGEGVFEPGDWTVHYVPGDGELTVKIGMDHVRVEMGGNTLEGAATDTFTGIISPADGVWQVNWTTLSDYTVHTPEGLKLNLATDPTYGETKPLTFEKVREP
jgi:hypothetical protein